MRDKKVFTRSCVDFLVVATVRHGRNDSTSSIKTISLPLFFDHSKRLRNSSFAVFIVFVIGFATPVAERLESVVAMAEV